MKKFLFFSTMALAVISTDAQTSNNLSIELKSSATLAAVCNVSAQNINFGQINLQAAQTGVSASSNMNVQCTKGSPYTITLNYGGNGGASGGGGFDVWQGNDTYFIYDVAGNHTGSFSATFSQLIGSGKVYATNYTTTSGSVFNSTAATTPGSIYVPPSELHAMANTGSMIGSSSGGVIPYNIFVPGQDSTIWNNTNGYSSTGTGFGQTFPIKATLQTTGYPAPDFYTSTVTVTMSY